MYGLTSFTMLFFIATWLYPGGTRNDVSKKSYSWSENYICDLAQDESFNGVKNFAKPMYIVAMGIFCFSVASLLVLFAQKTSFSKFICFALQISSISSMLLGMFLFTSLHDMVVFAVFILSILSITLTLSNLYKINWNRSFYIGLASCILLVFNYYVFLSKTIIHLLPTLQKITLAFFLGWFYSINFKLLHWSE